MIFALGEWYSCRGLALVANSGVSSLSFKPCDEINHLNRLSHLIEKGEKVTYSDFVVIITVIYCLAAVAVIPRPCGSEKLQRYIQKMRKTKLLHLKIYGVMNRSYSFTPELISLAERDNLYPEEDTVLKTTCM